MDKNKRLTPLKSKLKVAFCHKEKKTLNVQIFKLMKDKIKGIF